MLQSTPIRLTAPTTQHPVGCTAVSISILCDSVESQFLHLETLGIWDPGSLTPTQALRNGKPAIDRRLWYSQCHRWKRHRVDCVGFITRAWNIPIDAAYTVNKLKADFVNPVNCRYNAEHSQSRLRL